MIKKLLENQGIKLSQEEFKQVIIAATQDIKFNNIGFSKVTNLKEMLFIASICARALKKCA